MLTLLLPDADPFGGFNGPVGIAGGRSGGVIPRTDIADGSVGSLGARGGL